MRFLSLLTLLAIIGHASAADTAMNATCPVSGKPVDATVKTVPFNPKTDTAAKASPGARTDAVGFCCPKCEPTYVKDPEKYRAELEKQKSAKK